MKASAAAPLPLAVDLDGTLVFNETSALSAETAFVGNPLGAVIAAARLVEGMAAAKQAFARISRPMPGKLAFRKSMLDYLAKEKARGRQLHLVSGADQAIVDGVAGYLNLFDSARGSQGGFNLTGSIKYAWMAARWPRGFDYAGDSARDLQIWRAVGRAVLVGRAVRYANRLKAEGVVILASI